MSYNCSYQGERPLPNEGGGNEGGGNEGGGNEGGGPLLSTFR
ncbi:hypothetical protein AB6H26_16660 [Providencia hangzhouensis]